jgi:7-cyano-7-deazaguanine synthase
MPNAVLLLSGGLDSTTMLAYAIDAGFDVHAMTFRYGQRHAAEIDAARRVARHYRVRGARHRRHRSSHLRRLGAHVGHRRSQGSRRGGHRAGHSHHVRPARNTIFLSFCLAWSEVLDASDIFIGVNALDYSGYPDCRPEYVDAFQRMANLATRGGVEGTTPVRIQTPLLHRTKREIVQLGLSLGVDYALTLSCYDPSPDGLACGHCDSCQLRRKGFAEAGVTDPTRYAAAVG